MNLEGRRLGEFEILERVGQGAMGAVYKARQTSLDRFVALKTLQAALAGDADYIGRFRQEAKAAAGLHHANLVQVISAGESEGLHWFAMEYVEGESARARLERKGRLEPLEALAIAIHVATALDYAGRKAALIHRDIKPDNIFLSSDGEVKLGDLGLAKSTGQAAGLTTTGVLMGTPHYMSPEQAQGKKDVDLRADIYSLGCTLYHLLSGQPPYAGESAMAVMMQHMSAPVPDLHAVWPECPADLSRTQAKMMQKAPAARQQNYEEVMADLWKAHETFSGVGGPVVAPATSRKPIVAQRKSVAMGWIGSGLALLAAIGALFYFAPWKPGETPGGTRSVVSPTSAGEGGKKVGADGAAPSTQAPPASGGPIAVASTPQLEETPPPATQVPATPSPSPASPSPSTPVAVATPAPPTEVEKWLAQVDGPQEETFQKQVRKPFEAGVTDLRARYVKSLDDAIAKASAAGQLADALAWRTERQSFEIAQNVVVDDAGVPAGVLALRTSFRQLLARLDQERAAQAKTLLTAYDAILAKYQTLLTQHQRLDDALLLKTKRDEIAQAWLAPSTFIAVPAMGAPESVKPTPAKPAAIAAEAGMPASATQDKPFVNSLGMKFVPVPGTEILMCIHETRRRDYEAYTSAVSDVDGSWREPQVKGRLMPQTPDHPVVMVPWKDAVGFCAWLSKKEGLKYRLPTEHEWNLAVVTGLRDPKTVSAEELADKLNKQFPWGTENPDEGIKYGNYARQNDGYEGTAPVMSFLPNHLGIYDLGGNAGEWCSDWFDADHHLHVVRGCTFTNWGAFSRIRHPGNRETTDASGNWLSLCGEYLPALKVN